MSSFFEPPSAPPEPPGRSWAAQEAVLGRTVALNLILARSEKAAIWISALTAYPDSFEFELEVRHRLEDEDGAPLLVDHPHHHHRRRRTGDGGLDPEFLRFGIQFSNGGKATNLDEWHPPRPGQSDEPPSGPALLPGGGGGGGGHWRHRFTVRPLPPEGPIAIVCEWPIAGIPETRQEIDSALIRDAAADAIVLWEGEKDPRSGGGWTSQVLRSVSEPPKQSES